MARTSRCAHCQELHLPPPGISAVPCCEPELQRLHNEWCLQTLPPSRAKFPVAQAPIKGTLGADLKLRLRRRWRSSTTSCASAPRATCPPQRWSSATSPPATHASTSWTLSSSRCWCAPWVPVQARCSRRINMQNMCCRAVPAGGKRGRIQDVATCIAIRCFNDVYACPLVCRPVARCLPAPAYRRRSSPSPPWRRRPRRPCHRLPGPRRPRRRPRPRLRRQRRCHHHPQRLSRGRRLRLHLPHPRFHHRLPRQCPRRQRSRRRRRRHWRHLRWHLPRPTRRHPRSRLSSRRLRCRLRLSRSHHHLSRSLLRRCRLRLSTRHRLSTRRRRRFRHRRRLSRRRRRRRPRPCRRRLRPTRRPARL